MTTFEITKRGNTVGFDANGREICGQYSSKAKCWQVWIHPFVSLTGRNFPTLAQAKEYAASIIDEAKTSELAWW